MLAIPAQLVKNNLHLINQLNKKYTIEFLNHGYYIHTDFDKKKNKI